MGVTNYDIVDVDVQPLFKSLFGVTIAKTPATHIADASVAHALNATFNDTEVEAALNALGTKINAILAALENYGVVAKS